MLSAESKQRMSVAQRKARELDPTRFPRPKGCLGYRHSAEAKQKISNALRGRAKNASAVLNQAASLSRRPNGAVLRSPEGLIYRVVNGTAFARDYGLNQQSVSAVILGKRRIHKGWTLVTTTEAPR